MKGTYCGVAVAVCRVMPASSTIYKSMFGVSAKQNAAALRTGGAATNKGRPRRASASKGNSKERTSPLLEAQVVTSKDTPSCCFQAYWFTTWSMFARGASNYHIWADVHVLIPVYRFSCTSANVQKLCAYTHSRVVQWALDL